MTGSGNEQNRRIVDVRAILLFCALSSPSWAQTFSLGGEWRAPFTVGENGLKDENVMIRQNSDMIQATKMTGDEYVPAGVMNLRGTIISNPFAAEQICSGFGLEGAHWEKVRITVLDANHLKVEGGCSGNVIWTRLPGAHIS